MIVRCLFMVALSLLNLSFSAEAQQTGKVPHVGVLNPGSSSESLAVQRQPFEKGLRELGWVPDSNIVIEYRYGEGDIARLEALAAEMVRQRVDVIVARGNVAVRIAQQATITIPIVMSSAGDPVEDGFVKSLAQPGGNITGLANMVWELDGKRLELLKEAFPGIVRVAVLVNPNMESGQRRNEVAAAHANALVASARSLGLQLQIFEVTPEAGFRGVTVPSPPS